MSNSLSDVTKLVSRDSIPCQSRPIISQVRGQIQKTGKVTGVSYGVLRSSPVLFGPR